MLSRRSPTQTPDVAPDPDSKPDDVMLISVAEKYDVPLWHVIPTFVAFVTREEPLTEVEAAHMSLGTVIRLARAREDLLRKLSIGKPPSVAYRQAVAKDIAREIWPAPKKDVFLALRYLTYVVCSEWRVGMTRRATRMALSDSHCFRRSPDLHVLTSTMCCVHSLDEHRSCDRVFLAPMSDPVDLNIGLTFPWRRWRTEGGNELASTRDVFMIDITLQGILVSYIVNIRNIV